MIPNSLYEGENHLVLTTWEDCCVDMFLTSPPYDNLRTYNGFEWNFEAVSYEMSRTLKEGGALVWIVADATIDGSETLTSMKQAIHFKEKCGLKLRDTMVWEKSSFSATGALAVQYAPVWEYMFVFSKGKLKTFNPIMDKPNKHAGTPQHGTVRQPDGSVKPQSGIKHGKLIREFGQRHNVWRVTEEKRSKGHPAPFPIQLAKDHIVSWSNPGDTVVDPFVGSGTTCCAAIETGRKYVGIDVSKEYLDIARERIRITKEQYGC